MTIAVVDYGIGNLGSALKAFRHVGADAILTGDPRALESADALVLPGDGAFGATMGEIRARNLDPVIRTAVERRKPLLGICVGMQVFFEESNEQGVHAGFGFLEGQVRRLSSDLVVPHMGWNTLTPTQAHPILDGITAGEYVYFVHSYFCDAAPANVLATTDYGADLPAIAGQENLVAMQFHPEKSQAVGLRLIDNFVRWVRGGAREAGAA